jgi:hypothetical protein
VGRKGAQRYCQKTEKRAGGEKEAIHGQVVIVIRARARDLGVLIPGE